MDERHEGLMRQLEQLGGRTLAGWKVGLTSGRARDSMGEGFRPFGYVLAERCLESGATIKLDSVGDVGVENEMCFSFAKDLRKNANREDVMAAIDSVSPAFEINEQRLGRDASLADRLADDLSQWGIVVGAECVLDWRTFDFSAVEVVLSRNGSAMETVAAAGHIDDHFDSLAALSGTLARFDREIRAGERVITGSYTRQRIEAPGRWCGDFGEAIGQVEVEFV